MTPVETPFGTWRWVAAWRGYCARCGVFTTGMWRHFVVTPAGHSNCDCCATCSGMED